MKNRVVAVAEDKTITVDGYAVWFKDGFRLAPGHRRLWALQWNGRNGHLELQNPTENVDFDSSGYGVNVAFYVRQWEEEKARQEAEAEAEWNSPESVEERAREERNGLLAETDYILMPDYPVSVELREAWTAYRQALRDLPKQEGWPMNIVWPEKPE